MLSHNFEKLSYYFETLRHNFGDVMMETDLCKFNTCPSVIFPHAILLGSYFTFFCGF